MTRQLPHCPCGRPIRDGRCSAVPSCSDFKRPSQRAISLDAKLRKRERKSDAPIGLSSDAARDGYQHANPGYAAERAKGAERARKNWAKRGVK